MRKPRPKIGRRTFVDPSAQFIGCEYIEIGCRSIISEGSWFNVNDRTGAASRILVGDHCYIGRRTFMSSGRAIIIRPYCLISNDTRFLGADHDFSNPFIPYLVAPALGGGDIIIGTNCWMGSACTVLKGVSIGYGSVIGACSLVTKSIPPLSVAVGNPCHIIKRYHVGEMRWIPAAEWKDVDEESIPSETDYLEIIRQKHKWVSMPYVIGGSWFGNI